MPGMNEFVIRAGRDGPLKACLRNSSLRELVDRSQDDGQLARSSARDSQWPRARLGRPWHHGGLRAQRGAWRRGLFLLPEISSHAAARRLWRGDYRDSVVLFRGTTLARA